ncbi:MAG TPA: hypothetical protein VMC06_15020 [Opitutaceae bacterium]|nr:hypothetical protein [Opitutaceae bacterium]
MTPILHEAARPSRPLPHARRICRLLLALAACASAAAAPIKVVFSDSFNRPDAPTPGLNWEEFQCRRTANSVPQRGETNWCIKNQSLYFSATGNDSYIEDFVQSVRTYPVDNIKMEFDLRATAATSKGYVGPTCFLAPPASVRHDAMNVTSGVSGYIIGVEASYRWENHGSSGLVVFNNGANQDYASGLMGGVNQPGFAHHVIVIKNGSVTYSSDAFPAVTVKLANPLEPNARRHISFGARLYDAGIVQTIEIKNLKITELGGDVAPPEPPVVQPPPKPKPNFTLHFLPDTSASQLPRPESFYNDLAASFLRAAVSGSHLQLRALVTDTFATQHSMAELADFGSQLQTFAARETILQHSQPGANSTVETMLVQKNAQGRRITAQFIFVGEKIDLCVIEGGVQ